MDSRRTLHIRCGRDIEQKLRDAGFIGDFLDFSDPFCQGPVPDLPPAAFQAVRSRFIASAYGLDEAMVREQEVYRYRGLDRLHDHDHIVLWFEHDHFDQLILAYLLKHLGTLEKLPPVELICIDDYPVLPRFTGLGQLSVTDLKSLWPKRVAVIQTHHALGHRVWQALTAAEPTELAAIAETGTPEVPPMAGALDRHLWELPSSRHGLSLTETLSLRILAENGPLAAKKMFAALLLRYEPRPYLGDSMYWFELDRLVRGGAIELKRDADTWADKMMALSLLGEHILMTEEDWLDHMPEPRHVGGIAITPGAANWRRTPRGDVKFL